MTRSNARARNRQARSTARFAAVQALYQMDIAQTDLNAVIHEFETFRAEIGDEDSEPGEHAIAEADRTFFAEILRGVVRLQATIDPAVDRQLARGWRLVRVDSILRQILRAALFELIDRQDVPGRVVINEYIEIAKAFFDEEEPKVVNGVLDALAKQYRAPEFEGPRGERETAARAAELPDVTGEPGSSSVQLDQAAPDKPEK
ncbi:MAG: transcription antitermination factor NusB [Hyphomicrobiaceae bacterium]